MYTPTCTRTVHLSTHQSTFRAYPGTSLMVPYGYFFWPRLPDEASSPLDLTRCSTEPLVESKLALLRGGGDHVQTAPDFHALGAIEHAARAEVVVHQKTGSPFHPTGRPRQSSFGGSTGATALARMSSRKARAQHFGEAHL